MFNENIKIEENPHLFVIFGGTGDLTRRKLLPALYILYNENKFPLNSAIVIVGRQDKTDEEFRNEAHKYIEEYSRVALDEEKLKSFKCRIFYKKLDFVSDYQGYKDLKNSLEEIQNKYECTGNRLFYLAVAPQYFETIVRSLHEYGMLENVNTWQRILIEKPFGYDLKSAKELNNSLLSLVEEKNIFRIDHYLGKEMILNILAVRFGNSLFEPLWNNNYIDNIQITSSELLGVENRGGYYENAGILKDMLQNHLLQMLAIIAMEPPVSLEPEMIRDEKVKVLRSLRLFNMETGKTDIVRGQYGRGTTNDRILLGYREEDKVSESSNTDTFVALKTYIDNFRWGGVPIYIRSGKRINKKVTEIVIQFKKLPGINFYPDFKENEPNLLVIKIQPREGFFFQINAKKPESDFIMEQVQMDYCQSCRVENNSPEAYERIILEAIRNNLALFTRWDELEYSWNFVESIEKSTGEASKEFPNYSAGTAGPVAAFELIQNDKRQWWDINGGESL